MYGKQFSILATATDLAALDAALQLRSDVLLVEFDNRTGVFTPVLDAVPGPTEGVFDRWIARLPATPLSFTWRGADRVVADVDNVASEIIEYWQPWSDGKIVRRGRLYYRHRHNDGSARDAEFCRWADRVMAWVKRQLTYDPKYLTYMGADARRAIAEGRLVVVNN